jgi:hypothetical protein
MEPNNAILLTACREHNFQKLNPRQVLQYTLQYTLHCKVDVQSSASLQAKVSSCSPMQ